MISTAVGGVVDLLGPAVTTAVSPQSGERFEICARGISVPPNDAGSLRRRSGAAGGRRSCYVVKPASVVYNS